MISDETGKISEFGRVPSGCSDLVKFNTVASGSSCDIFGRISIATEAFRDAADVCRLTWGPRLADSLELGVIAQVFLLHLVI